MAPGRITRKERGLWKNDKKNVTIQPQIHTDLSAFGGLTQIDLNTKKSQKVKNYNLCESVAERM